MAASSSSCEFNAANSEFRRSACISTLERRFDDECCGDIDVAAGLAGTSETALAVSSSIGSCKETSEANNRASSRSTIARVAVSSSTCAFHEASSCDKRRACTSTLVSATVVASRGASACWNSLAPVLVISAEKKAAISSPALGDGTGSFVDDLSSALVSERCSVGPPPATGSMICVCLILCQHSHTNDRMTHSGVYRDNYKKCYTIAAD